MHGVRGIFVVFALVANLMFAGREPSSQDTGPAEPRAARPQEPKALIPYMQEDVSYANPQAVGVELHGTLTKPPGKPAPVVLLLTGAGPQDRDETMAGHKPFSVLADYLTRRGIAVLRVDDRGTGESTGSFATATTKDFASDAEAGVHFLLDRSDVDGKHLGLIGHGEGALEAVMIAARMPAIKFVVLLAGTGVTGDKVLLAQTMRAEIAAHLSDDQIDADERIGAVVYESIRRGHTAAELERAMNETPEDLAPFIAPWRHQIPRLDAPWLRFFLTYDPRPALEEMHCPVLALFGSKDMQVDPEQNAAAMKSAFSHGHNRDAKVKVLPGLNYLFQKADTGLAYEYERIPETMSPVALATIGDWVTAQTDR